MTFREILETYEIHFITEGNSHCREGWIQMHCPFCDGGQKKYHLGYSIAANHCNCWRCGYHSVYSILAEYTNLSYAEIKELLRSLKTERIKTARKPSKLVLPNCIGDLTDAHRTYLKRRRYNPNDIVRLWGVQGIGLSLELSWRLFIPIHYDGRIVSWTTRALSNKTKLRYITAKNDQQEMPLKHLLYGQDYATDTIVVCEGIFDVWRIGPGAVATFGMNCTREQIAQMAKFKRRAICFDNEPEAQRQANKLARTLSLLGGETYNIQITAKDPDAANEAEIRKIKEFLRS